MVVILLLRMVLRLAGSMFWARGSSSMFADVQRALGEEGACIDSHTPGSWFSWLRSMFEVNSISLRVILGCLAGLVVPVSARGHLLGWKGDGDGGLEARGRLDWMWTDIFGVVGGLEGRLDEGPRGNGVVGISFI